MSWFDAVCHAFSTISIGGFSTYDANFAHFEQTELRWTAVVSWLFRVLTLLHYIAWTKKKGFTLLLRF